MYRWLLSENRCGRVIRDLFETISYFISVALTKHHSASRIALWLLNSAIQWLPSTEKTSFMDLLFRRQSTFQLYIPVKNLRIAPVVGPSLMVQENHVAPSSVRSEGWTHRIRPGMLAHSLIVIQSLWLFDFAVFTLLVEMNLIYMRLKWLPSQSLSLSPSNAFYRWILRSLLRYFYHHS